MRHNGTIVIQSTREEWNVFVDTVRDCTPSELIGWSEHYMAENYRIEEERRRNGDKWHYVNMLVRMLDKGV